MDDLVKQEQAARQVLDIVIRVLEITPSDKFKAFILDEWYRHYGRAWIGERQ